MGGSQLSAPSTACLLVMSRPSLTELTVSLSVAISPSTLMSIVRLRLPCGSPEHDFSRRSNRAVGGRATHPGDSRCHGRNRPDLVRQVHTHLVDLKLAARKACQKSASSG